MVIIEPLTRHRPLLTLIAKWLVSEWPAWYGPGGTGDVDNDLRAFAASEDVLPIGMVAFEDDVPVGIAVLKGESVPSHRHLGPWAACGFVLPEHRGRGAGSLLLHAVARKADDLGYPNVYCATSTSKRLLERAGWFPMETTLCDGCTLTVFRMDLASAGMAAAGPRVEP
jgi:GNAT superfamily N-acetyltransferase